MTAVPSACIVGWPAKHSRSPLIHGHWLRTLGLEGSYGCEEVRPEDVVGFLQTLQARGYVGCNVTVPHKEAAFGAMDVLTDRARALEAVNTVWIENGVLHGDNTDILGFVASLDAETPGWASRTAHALVLGAGGAARAIVAGLLDRGVELVTILNRTRDRSEQLAEFFGKRVQASRWDAVSQLVPSADMVVNTTSLGMSGQPELDISLEGLKPGAVVTDAVYIPLETRLLAEARRRGNPVVDGLGMLLHQAAPGFEHWFGKRPEVTPALRQLIVDDLARSAR
ncbi:shikimate dehydrogenase (NADP(+)) [Alsobacter metallidurans]|uniref:Shikimate dehydrogenase (NADP(+)) n=1 Tax=Alsobacter metallidurans TaxID=340221 RepID=A0A917IBK8_9HYPH|nr:shikimate dehydrogenase [Alsobacter metallidurans]GGH33667.1 shikimate dehydrogenase (NADP(+)) [Alsobacter metallidurans]